MSEAGDQYERGPLNVELDRGHAAWQQTRWKQ
jgi:hypothetical protein